MADKILPAEEITVDKADYDIVVAEKEALIADKETLIIEKEEMENGLRDSESRSCDKDINP